MYEMSFIDACVAGLAGIDDVDDYIDYWHDGGHRSGLELHEFLGMNDSEYGLLLRTGGADSVLLDAIARRQCEKARENSMTGKTAQESRAVPA